MHNRWWTKPQCHRALSIVISREYSWLHRGDRKCIHGSSNWTLIRDQIKGRQAKQSINNAVSCIPAVVNCLGGILDLEHPPVWWEGGHRQIILQFPTLIHKFWPLNCHFLVPHGSSSRFLLPRCYMNVLVSIHDQTSTLTDKGRRWTIIKERFKRDT